MHRSQGKAEPSRRENRETPHIIYQVMHYIQPSTVNGYGIKLYHLLSSSLSMVINYPPVQECFGHNMVSCSIPFFNFIRCVDKNILYFSTTGALLSNDFQRSFSPSDIFPKFSINSASTQEPSSDMKSAAVTIFLRTGLLLRSGTMAF